jgi:hypothetical protein
VAADVTVAPPVALPADAVATRSYARRFGWTVVAVTVGAALVSALAGPGSGAAPAVPLAWLLFVGSSVHVTATLALFSFADVRAHARRHPNRYLIAPAALLITATAGCLLLPPPAISLPLLGFFGWQLWHYQKQNLGLASLALASARLPLLSRLERRCIVASGIGGILALVAHPSGLQLVAWRPPPPVAIGSHTSAELVLVASATTALTCTVRRWMATTTTPPATGVYLMAVIFPAPLLLTSSPYAAVGGLTLAHGLQYLLLVGHVMVGSPAHRSERPSAARLAAVMAIVVAAAGVLATTAHLHGRADSVARALFGAYLAAVMAHFVVDAGLWRLRDEFPRGWLGERIPRLLGRPAG